MPAIVIRPAIAADAPSACALVRASIEELCALDHGHDPTRLADWLANKTPENFVRWIAAGQAHTLIAETGGRIAGFAQVRRGTLLLCYVAPALTRIGVGSHLLAALERQAHGAGRRALRLESSRTALPFYAAHGYLPAAPGSASPAAATPLFKPLGDIQLLPVAATDAEELVALRIAAMRPSLERLGRFDPGRARQRFLSGFNPVQTRHIEWRGRKVGFLVATPSPNALKLEHLYLHPAAQGQGIGSHAMALVIAQAAALKRPIEVGALRGSDANRFYLRHGFVLREETEWDNHYLRPLADDAP